MMAIFYKTILRLNYLKSLNKIELPVQLPPEVCPPPGYDDYVLRRLNVSYAL